MVTRLFPYIRSWLLLCLVLLVPFGKALAQNGLQVLGLQVPIGSSPSSFTQNFDALNAGITVNLAGLVGNVDGIYSNRTLIVASTGSPDLVSGILPTGGGYSFGTTSERALGSNSNLLNSAVGLIPIRYGAMIQNNTGLPITSFTITYTGEQWYRDGDGAAQTLFFEYVPLGTVGSGLLGSLLNSTFLLAGGIGEAISLGGITYNPVSVSALNFVSPNFSGGATTLDGNAAGNRTTKTATINVNIPAGGYILLRWTDPDDPDALLDLTGTDHSLAVDNLIVSATTLNSSPTVTGVIPSQSVAIGSSVNIPTSGAFTEPDGQTLAYSATGLPTGLAISTTSGAITGTPSVTGVYPITVRVSDPQGLSTSTTFSLTVNPPSTNVTTSGPTCAGQNLTLSGLLPVGLPAGAMVVLKGPNNFSVVVGGTGIVSIPTGTGGLPSGNYNLTLVASASLPLVGTVELLNLPVPVSILPLPALPTGLASQTAAVGSLLSLTGVCEAGSVLNYATSTGLSGSSLAGIIPISTVSSGIQTVTALCVNVTSGCVSPSQLLNINVLNLIGDAINALPTNPVCLGQPLNLSLLGTGLLADLTSSLLSLSIAGPNGFLVTTSSPGSVLSLTGLPAGTYSLTITGALVPILGSPIIVPPIQVPVTVISLAPVTGLLASNTVVQNGMLTLIGSCPTGILSYSSASGSGTALSGIGIPIPTGTTGIQSLTVVCLDPNGCLSVPTVANINVLAPVLNVVQGALACVGQTTSLTLLPTNFLLNDPLVNVSITGPAGVTVGALGSNGVVSIGGLSTTATSLTVSVSIAGTPLINLPVSVSALPLPALPNLPATLTTLAGAPLSLSGLCPTGVLGTLSNLTQGIIPINTATPGVQSLSIICNNGGCISPTQVLSLSILNPVLNVVQGALACVGQATSLTLLPTNFGLTDPLIGIGITGPAGVTVGALGSNGVVSIGGLSTTATTLTVSLSVAGTQILSLPVSVSALPLPALPNLPTTLTTLVGSTLSLSGLCPTGILGTLSNLTQGIIPINTTTAGVQTLSLVCSSGGCISPTQILNLSVIGGSLIPGAISPICLGQVLNLPLTGSGSLSDLTSNLVSLSVSGPVNLTTTVLGPGLIRISGLTAGTSNLTITPSVSNIPLAPITVPVNVISLSAVTGLLPTQSVIQNTTLTLTGTCPTGGILSYTNSGGSSGTALSGTGIPVVTNILGGQSYTVVCTDANGCISPATVANLSVVSPLLNVLQGPLVCVGQPVSLTLLPTNFLLTDPLVNVAITGPTGVTASAVGSNGVVTLSGLSSATTTLAVSVSVAGIQVLNQPLTVNSLPLPAAPNLPATLTALTGSTLSLSGLCPTGTLGTLLQPLQGIINVPTTATGIQSLTLTCTGANGCISPTSIVNLSVVSPLLNTLTNSPICLGSPLALTLVPLNFGLNDGVVSLSVTGPVNSTVSAIGPNGVVSIGGLPAGTSTITVTARIAGIPVNTITIPVSVLSTPAPSVTTVSGQTAYAGGQTAVSVTVNSGNVLFQGSCQSGVLSYTGSVGGAVNTGAQTSFITVPTTTTGVFTYTAICVNGACISTGTVVSVSVVNATPTNQSPTLVGGGIPSPQSATVNIGFSLPAANYFTDPNGDPLTYAASGLPAGLSITPGTGVISGVPSVSGTFPVSVTANDGKGGTVSSSFILNVAPAAVVNQPPSLTGALPTPQSATVGVAFSTTTAGAFTDPNGDPLSFTATGLPTGLVINPTTGVISGVPAVSGTTGVIVTVSDGKGGTAQGFFILNVAPAPVNNTPPTLVGGGIPSPQSATVGVAFSTTTAGAFFDANGDPLSFTATGLPAGLGINPATGVISGVPTTSGLAGVSVTASDGKGGSVTSTFILNVFPAPAGNLPPNIVGGGIPTPQSATVGFAYSTTTAGAFSDPNGDPLSFTATGLPTGVTINPTTGFISGVPSVSGTFGIVVTANDGKGGIAQAVYVLNVAPAPTTNTPPTLAGNIPSPQSATVGVAFSTTTAGAFSDPNGDPLTFSASNLPNGLTMGLNNGIISGTPSVSGTFGVIVTASDGRGGSVQAALVINVVPAAVTNLPPSIVGNGIPSPQSATVGVAFSTTTAGAFTDPNGDPLTFAASGLPAGLAISPTNGVISGIPSVSGTFPVSVSASDGRGGTAQSFFILNVSPAPAINLPPVIVGNGIPSPQSATVTIAFSTTTAGAFSDPNGDPLSFTATGLPTGLAISPSTGLISGVPSVSGSFGIVVTASDGRGGTAQSAFVLNVVPLPATNLPPSVIASLPSPQSGTVNVAFSTTTAGAFSDPNGDPLTFSTTGLPSGLAINPTTGVISGVPTQSGSFGVTVFANDGKGGTASAPFTLNISPAPAINLPPLAGVIPSPQSTTVGVVFSTTTAGAFFDPNGDALTFSTSGLPTGLSINPATGLISGIASQSGVFGIVVTANDNRGGSAQAFFFLNVAPAPTVNVPPALVGNGLPSPQSATVGVAFSTTTAGAFFDANGDPLTFSVAGLPAGLNITPSTGVISGVPSVSGTFPVSVTANDGKGGFASSVFILNVSPAAVVNQPPTVVGNGLPSPQSATVGIAFSTTTAGAFTDPNGDPLTFSAQGLPTGLSIIPSTGVISGVPSVTGSFGVIVTANDGKGGTAQAAFILNVVPAPVVNQPPTLVGNGIPSPQSATVNVAFSTTTAGAFTDPNGDPLTFSANGLPAGLSIIPSTGVITGVPSASGTFGVTVIANDGKGGSASSTFILNVFPAQGPNLPPVIVGNGLPSPQSATVGLAFSTTTAGAFSDPNGDPLTFSAQGLPNGLSINPTTGQITGVPTTAGNYGIIVTAGDGKGGTAQAAFILNVVPAATVNLPPVIVGNGLPSPQSATVGVAFSTTTAGAFSDPNGDPLSFSATGLPTGLVIIPSTGLITGVPSVSGTYAITVFASDGRGGSASSIFILMVYPAPTVNLPPVIVGNGIPSPQSATVGVAFSTTTAGAFSDPNGDPLSYTVAGLPTGLAINPGTGLISGVPSVSGIFGVIVTANDGKGGIASAPFILNVVPAAALNQPPVLVGNGIPSPQSATVNVAFSTTTAGAFTDPNGDPLTFAAGGLPNGLSINPNTGVISGAPSVSGTFPVSVTANDGKGGTATSVFILNVAPAPVISGPLGVTVAAYNCITGAITFGRIGGDPSRQVEYLALNATAWTTSPFATIGADIRNDPTMTSIVVFARYVGDASSVVTTTFNFRAFCGSQGNSAPVYNGSLANQVGTVGTPFTYTFPANAFTDPEGQTLTFTAVGLPPGLTLTGRTISGTPQLQGAYAVTILAQDPQGASTTGSFTITVNPAPVVGTPLGVTVVSYNCQTGAIVFNRTGGDPSRTVEYFAIGVRLNNAAPYSTNPNGTIEAELRNDQNQSTITVMARYVNDPTSTVTFVYNFRTPCAGQTPNQAPVYNGGLQNLVGIVGVPFSYTLPKTLFSDPENEAITLGAGGLPPGIILLNGVISGTPITAGVFEPVYIFGFDPQRLFATGTFRFTVNQPTAGNQAPIVTGSIPNQTATVGIFYTYTIPSTVFRDPENQALTYRISGAPRRLDVNGNVISGFPLINGVYPITVTAFDPQGGSASVTYQLTVLPNPGCGSDPATLGQQLDLLQPDYNCQTGVIKFNTRGGNGSPITFAAIGITVPTNDCYDQMDEEVSVDVRNDKPNVQPFIIRAIQSGVVVQYSFDARAYCRGRAREATGVTPSLDVTVLGNPTNSDAVEVIIRGAEGEPLRLRVADPTGNAISEQHVDQAGAAERVRIPLSRAAGVYLLQVSSPTRTKVVKVVRQ